MENELVVIEKENALEIFSTEGGIDPFLQEVTKIVDDFEPDTTTAKGRKAIASMARKVSTFKVTVDEMGKELVVGWKAQAKLVDGSRKHARDTLDALRDRARKPLTEWEDKEKARIAGHREAIELLKALVENEEETATVYAANLEQAKIVAMGVCWEEFAAEAATVKDEVVGYLETALAKALKAESAAADLERLRKEQEKREQQERDDAIAKAAADKAREDAEKEIREANERAEKAETDKADAEATAKLDKVAAVARGVAEEKQKIEDEAAEKAEAQRKKEVNTRHRRKIHGEAYVAFVAKGFSDEDADLITKAIVAGEIPNVSINY